MPIVYAGADLAARYLRTLLERPGRYRDRWVRRAEKPRSGQISQAAVARVLAEYLNRYEGKDDDEAAYRHLKDRVHRALSGQALTPDTLEWFTRAFLLTEDDARSLWSRFVGGNPEQTDGIIRRLAPPPTNAAAFEPLRYETVELYETHYVDRDGRPEKHETIQSIRATADGVSRYPLRIDTKAHVQVEEGVVRASDTYRCDDDIYAIDVMLPHELREGECIDVRYSIFFEDDCAQQSVFRRAAYPPIENMTVEIKFDTRKIPRSVVWATWRDFSSDSPMLTCEPMEPDDKGVVRKCLRSAKRTVVGFVWNW